MQGRSSVAFNAPGQRVTGERRHGGRVEGMVDLGEATERRRGRLLERSCTSIVVVCNHHGQQRQDMFEEPRMRLRVDCHPEVLVQAALASAQPVSAHVQGLGAVARRHKPVLAARQDARAQHRHLLTVQLGSFHDAVYCRVAACAHLD